MSELKIEDPMQFRSFIRMRACDFEELINKIGPIVRKQDTHFRKAISVEERLAVTLRYFASGDSYESLSVHFRIPKCTISMIVKEVSTALVQCLKEFMQLPTTENDWMNISREFEEKWQFPHCVGALDGKHITIEAPRNSGSFFFNYKGFHSIVLMALVDANYKFIAVSVGCNGRVSDGGVFAASGISSFLEKELPRLKSNPLPKRNTPMPYVVVADDAFPLSSYLMKPHPYHTSEISKRIFNYRLSRARRMVESVFGLLSTTFRILRRPINLKVDNIETMILSICYIHNFMRSKKNSENMYTPRGLFDEEDTNLGIIKPGTWRNNGGMSEQNLLELPLQGSNNYSANAKELRKEFEEYFISPQGEVPWQYKFL